jgi:probable F420-dependent oxidoreductase
VTRRIRLGTGICLVPQRNPVYTAKDVATVDCLSDGRVDFGVGIGWLAEEFQALDVPFERRAQRTREYLEVMRRLWCEPVSQYAGELYQLNSCRQYPKPIQQPHPPIHFGGESDAALRRVADLGQGWYPFSINATDLGARLRDLDVLLARRNRKRTDVTISVCPYMHRIDFDEVCRYRDVGVDQVILLVVAATPDDLRRTLEKLAATMVEPAKAL